MIRVQAMAYRLRGIVMSPFYIVLVLVFVWELEYDAIVWPVGLAVFFVGVAVRVWAQTQLHYRLRIRKHLTTTGPYAYVRNPIYIANTFMLVGLTIMSELIWFVPIMTAWCALVYSAVVRYEEHHLADKYGEPYLRYREATPRWIPRTPDKLRHTAVKPYLWPSLVAEAHCLLLLIPLIGKEFI